MIRDFYNNQHYSTNQEMGFKGRVRILELLYKSSITNNSLFIAFSIFSYNFSIFFLCHIAYDITQISNKVEIHVFGSLIY